MEHEFFGRFSTKISGSYGTSEKVVLFFRTECSKRKFLFHFFNKAIFNTCFKFSRPCFGKWNWFVQMVNAIRGRKLRVLNFVYHLRKPFTDRFAHVNRKQPMPQYRARYQYGVCLNCSSTFWEIEISYKSRGTMKGKRHITHGQISKT